MKSVAIVILNWNGLTDTLECIKETLTLDYKNYHIIIVDNGSTDDSVRELKKVQNHHTSLITLLTNKSNKGFAGGVNTGIKYALEKDYEYIALLNNDAIPDKDWLNNILKPFNDNEVGISTGLLLNRSGDAIDSSGEMYSKWGLPFPRSRDDPSNSAPTSQAVFGATGGASVYRAELFEEIGLFDEDFFAYYEDVDISFRAQLYGWKVFYTSEARAYHKKGATSDKLPGFTVTQTFKNLPWLYIKNVPREILLYVGVRFALAYALMFAKSIFKGSGHHALKGILISIVKLPSKINERKSIIKESKSDTEYIKSLLWNDLPPQQIGLKRLRKLFTGK